MDWAFSCNPCKVWASLGPGASNQKSSLAHPKSISTVIQINYAVCQNFNLQVQKYNYPIFKWHGLICKLDLPRLTRFDGQTSISYIVYFPSHNCKKRKTKEMFVERHIFHRIIKFWVFLKDQTWGGYWVMIHHYVKISLFIILSM
jgi:hypothetical protein